MFFGEGLMLKWLRLMVVVVFVLGWFVVCCEGLLGSLSLVVLFVLCIDLYLSLEMLMLWNLLLVKFGGMW